MSRDYRDDVSRPNPPVPDRADRRERAAHGQGLRRTIELPRTPERRPVVLDRSRFMLRNAESELLETVGAFRAIAVRDLKDVAETDIRSLRGQGLLHTRGLVVNGRSEPVVVLTRTGRELLGRSCGSHVGLVKARELEHDAQLYRMFRTRVVLDYQLAADYHRYVHAQQLAGVDVGQARRAFAEAHDLPFAGERVRLPDVHVEYETADGHIESRDLELATEHYSRSRIGAKLSAGFRVYRAAGAGAQRGGAPSDPHHLEWIR